MPRMGITFVAFMASLAMVVHVLEHQFVTLATKTPLHFLYIEELLAV